MLNPTSGRVRLHCPKVRLYLFFVAAQMVAGVPAVAQSGSNYAATILADHPVVYYRLDEARGSIAADSSGNNHNGSYLGGVTLGQVGALKGDTDTSVFLDGSTGYVNSGVNLLSLSTTIEAWVLPTRASGDPNNAYGQEVIGGMSGSIQLTFGQKPGYARVWLWPLGGTQYSDWQIVDTAAPLTLSTWTHVVATWDDGTKQFSIYVNGVLSATQTLPGVTSSVQSGYEGLPFTIGSFGVNYGQWFQGGMDEVAYYNYALSPQQVLAHYNAGTSGCQITAPSDGASPQSGFVALAGTCTAEHSLDVLVAGSSVGQVTVDSEGKWEALPYIAPFGASVTVQVEDQDSSTLSNVITVHPVTLGLPPHPGDPRDQSVTPPTSLLPIRHGDIFVDANPHSFERILYGATYTHAALYLGGDAVGTPWLAEAVTAGEAGPWGQVRSLPLEQSLVWAAPRIAGYTPLAPFSGSTRDSIVAWAEQTTKLGLPYWKPLPDLAVPIFGAYIVWAAYAGNPPRPLFQPYLTFLANNKNATSKYICSTLVWRAYWEGSGHTLDISTPNNMTAQPGSILGVLPIPFRGAFIDQLRPVLVVPETFVTSPKLKQIF